MTGTHEPGKLIQMTKGRSFLRAVEPLLVEIEVRMRAMGIASLSLTNAGYCLIRTVVAGGEAEAVLIGNTDHLEGDPL